MIHVVQGVGEYREGVLGVGVEDEVVDGLGVNLQFLGGFVGSVGCWGVELVSVPAAFAAFAAFATFATFAAAATPRVVWGGWTCRGPVLSVILVRVLRVALC